MQGYLARSIAQPHCGELTGLKQHLLQSSQKKRCSKGSQMPTPCSSFPDTCAAASAYELRDQQGTAQSSTLFGDPYIIELLFGIRKQRARKFCSDCGKTTFQPRDQVLVHLHTLYRVYKCLVGFLCRTCIRNVAQQSYQDLLRSCGFHESLQ